MLRIGLQIAALGGLLWFGTKLAGATAPKGLRGGVLLMVVSLALIFLIARTFAVNIEGTTGKAIGLAVAGILLFGAVRFFTGPAGTKWMVSLEEQGWFSVLQYKRSLGVQVRRLTILGILLITGSGLYTLMTQGLIPDKLTVSVPWQPSPITLLGDAKIMVPLILGVLSLWVAFRAVNIPDFAEFLIATEAEMNKVSWSTRKRLGARYCRGACHHVDYDSLPADRGPVLGLVVEPRASGRAARAVYQHQQGPGRAGTEVVTRTQEAANKPSFHERRSRDRRHPNRRNVDAPGRTKSRKFV